MRFLVVIIFTMVISFSLTSCGKKAPPRLPKAVDSNNVEAPIEVETETTITETTN